MTSSVRERDVVAAEALAALTTTDHFLNISNCHKQREKKYNELTF